MAVRPPRQRYQRVQLGVEVLGELFSGGHIRREQGQSACTQLGDICSRRMFLVDRAYSKGKDFKSCALAHALNRREKQICCGAVLQ